MNVTELARKLKILTPQLREIMPRLGFDIGRRAIKVDDRVAEKIIQKYKKNPELFKNLTQPKVSEKETKEKEETVKKSKILELPEAITVRDFATLLQKPVTDVIQELMKNGILANLNERIDYETATIIAEDFGLKTTQRQERKIDSSTIKIEELLKEDKKNLQSRPPVIVVMGHVDHGKTKLLDAIRRTDVVAQEAGGITQSIGAYQVKRKNKLLTFIDTPGHEAFITMRSRGARIADIAILVVAADDGIKPQTREAINIIQSAELPFIVAINKIDKPESDIEKVKQQLAQHNLLSEDWGGKTICVPVSAQANKGIDDLLEHLLLVAEMQAEKIKANPKREALGTIIESHIDKGEGPVATVLIQAGTLSTGDVVKVGEVVGKIKAIKDFAGKNIDKATPSMPVKILGLKDIPEVGDILQVEKGELSLKEILKKQKAKVKTFKETLPITIKKTKEEDKEEKKIKKLNIVMKANTLGSQEAILQYIEKIQLEDLKVKVTKKGLGNITEADVLEAASAGSIIYGFNILVGQQIEEIARENNVAIKNYQVIYELIDDVKKEAEKLLAPEVIKIELGRIKVLAIFRTEKKSMIIGGQVTKGKIENDSKAIVLRNKEKITEGNITQLQSAKQDVSEVAAGSECGIRFEGPTVIQVDDILEVYKEEKKIRKLA